MDDKNLIIDRFIKDDGSVSVKHNDFGLCIIINLDIVSEDVVILDCKGIKHNVTLSDLTLVD